MLWTKQRALFTKLGIRRFGALPITEKFTITPEIKNALKRNGPVVALESTIISHG